jgi:thiol-disulfide isomerase/thioredoxin
MQLAVRIAVLTAALMLALTIGAGLRVRSGRLRTVRADAAVTAADLGVALGDRATFLQFSAPVCAPCRATRRVLGELTAALPGVTHVEVDALDRIDLADRLRIVRTPTVLVLDAAGRVVRRASGGLTAAQARLALGAAVPGMLADGVTR